jgi:hypothetical protein
MTNPHSTTAQDTSARSNVDLSPTGIPGAAVPLLRYLIVVLVTALAALVAASQPHPGALLTGSLWTLTLCSMGAIISSVWLASALRQPRAANYLFGCWVLVGAVSVYVGLLLTP